ncbi:hypothetical protein GQ600_2747 [Phytophthora cactorum]|nr:hypothetical protein GQ600_2747 [Phytophthora cactorum]
MRDRIKDTQIRMMTTATTDLPSEEPSFFEEAAATGGDDRIEADRVVFARSASIRRSHLPQ